MSASQQKLVRCFSCGGTFREIEGPTHRYMESTPGCWAAYGEVLARQYNDSRYAGSTQRIVDAYAVQHPGKPSPQSIQSVALHLVSLCFALEHGATDAETTQMIARVASAKPKFEWLAPPASVGDINVATVHAAQTPTEHISVVRAWALSSWAAWSAHHETVRQWLPTKV